jgi:Protein of unknown function (DUF3102)
MSSIPTTETILAEHAAVIRARGKRVIGDIIEIGRRLTEAKKIAGHGNWLPWLKREFGWAEQTARNYMQVHDWALKSPTVGDLDIQMRGLYLLAAPSTPDEARAEVIARAESGEALSLADVARAVDEVRNKQEMTTGTGAHKPRKELERSAADIKAADRAEARASNFAPPDTRPPTDPTKYDDVRAHRQRLDQLQAMLNAFAALEKLGDADQVAEAVVRLDVGDPVPRLLRVSAFATRVITTMNSKLKSSNAAAAGGASWPAA